MLRHLQRTLVVMLALLGILPAAARAQQATTISGRVVGDALSPLPGASVSIGTLSAGAMTDANGRYSFTVPASRVTGQTVVLTARRIGYAAKMVTVTLTGAPITQDFSLSATATQLTGLVVTALGQTREKSQLGTAQQQISSAELNTTKSLSVVDQLQGKVSGVQITGSGTQGGSTNIIIRGSNSITGNNQPLFVVDGVPVSNQDRGGDANGAFDYGGAINDINPEDIETMSVLKGPNAAALYGSRAANGVIIITMKKGRNTNGHGRTDASTLFTMDSPSRLWDYQNTYGQGAAGAFQYVDGQGGGVHDDLDQSFGPKMDGRTTGCTFVAGSSTVYDTAAPCLQFTNPKIGTPFIAHPDNVKDFFANGHTSSSNIAVTGGTDRANARLSIGVDNTAGIIPNNFFQKTSGLLSGNLQISDKFSTTANLQYVRNSARNRPGTGYNVGIMESMIWFGRQVDMNALKANYNLPGSTNGGPADREYNWNYNFHNNPFWLQHDNPLYDARDRLVASASATYKLLDWVNATLSSGSDIFTYNINQDYAHGNLNWADAAFAGGFNHITDYRNENNTQLLLTGTHSLGGSIQFNGTAGSNLRAEQATTNSVSTSGLSVPNIYNVSNAAITPTLGQYLSRRQVNSMFGSAAFTYDNWWTVEGTARNDWSSTLPQGANSYFYPSINTSIVLSDAIPAIKDHGITFLKLRGSLAQVGNDADPYKLRTVYLGNSNKFNGLPQFSLNDVIANPILKPEITKSSEAGVELGLLDGRVTLDGSVYSKSTRNQIFNVTISPATGFSSKSINAGQIDNRGVEALLTLVPIRTTGGLEWSTTFNYTHNRSKVAALAPGIQTIVLGSTWGVSTQARLGDPYGDLYGYRFLRDSATQKLITIPATRPDGLNEGLTQRGPLKVLGNIQPNWIGSWNNTFTYKNYSLNVLVDARRGGQFFSVSNFFGDYSGVTKASLLGRGIDWNKPGYVVPGIAKQSCGAGSHVNTAGDYVCVGGGTPNVDPATSEDYFQNIYPVQEASIITDNWVKLREVRFGVDLPTSLANHMRVSAANVAVVGRNLWLSTNVPNIDPEFSYSTGNNQGSEFAALPNARSVGFSVRVTP